MKIDRKPIITGSFFCFLTPLEYFRLCETFFRKKIHQRVPLQCFDIFRENGC